MARRRIVGQFPAASRLLRIVHLLWISFLLLHAPLPVFHEHGGDIDGMEANESLLRHVLRFHSHDADHKWFAWHVHWVQASDMQDGECPDGESEHGSQTEMDVVVVGPFASPVLPSLDDQSVRRYEVPVSLWLGSRTESVFRCEFLPRHFLQTYPSTLPVRALLSVALC